MAEFKDFVAIGTVLVSAGSAIFAYYANTRATEANQRANQLRIELDQTKFTADTSIKLLEMTYTTLANANDTSKRIAACKYATTLALIEEQRLKNSEPLIKAFLNRMIEGGDVDPSCQFVVAEALGGSGAVPTVAASEPAPAPTPTPSPEPSTPAPVPAPAPTPAPDQSAAAEAGIGMWHAVIASYDTSSTGCDHAREDVERFRSRLPAEQFEGAMLGVVRTRNSNNYAVTLDLGDDKGKAQQASEIIRKIGSTLPTREGADSFVQQNRSWTLDPSCELRLEL